MGGLFGGGSYWGGFGGGSRYGGPIGGGLMGGGFIWGGSHGGVGWGSHSPMHCRPCFPMPLRGGKSAVTSNGAPTP